MRQRVDKQLRSEEGRGETLRPKRSFLCQNQIVVSRKDKHRTVGNWDVSGMMKR